MKSSLFHLFYCEMRDQKRNSVFEEMFFYSLQMVLAVWRPLTSWYGRLYEIAHCIGRLRRLSVRRPSRVTTIALLKPLGRCNQIPYTAAMTYRNEKLYKRTGSHDQNCRRIRICLKLLKIFSFRPNESMAFKLCM